MGEQAMSETTTEKPVETTLDEAEDMWYDDGSGILRELVPCYDLKDGSTVFVKTSRFKMYDDDEVLEDG
jgi:hypothetical protein